MGSFSSIPHIQVFKSVASLNDENCKDLLVQQKGLEQEFDKMKENPFYNANPISIRIDQLKAINNQIQRNMMQVIEKAKEAFDFLETELVSLGEIKNPDDLDDDSLRDTNDDGLPDELEIEAPVKKKPGRSSKKIPKEDDGGDEDDDEDLDLRKLKL